MKILQFILVCLFLIGCGEPKLEDLTVRDIELFKNTPAWELAKAVDKQKTSTIKTILTKNPKLADFQEPIFGTTLLMRAVSSEKYKSVKALLENGANPNIAARIGSLALFRAISYSWYDSEYNTDAKFVKLLLEYGADPNLSFCSPVEPGHTKPYECGKSPLMHAVSRSLKKTKVLVEAEADINYKTQLGTTAAINALKMVAVDAAYYLIVEKKAKVSDPFYYYGYGKDKSVINYAKPHYPVDLLYHWVYKLDTEEYRKKMVIVQEFKKQGIDYFDSSRKIPKGRLNQIKKLYPDNWEEILEKY